MMRHTKPILGDQESLLDYLEEALQKAVEVKIIVSFLMESGVRLLLKPLEELVNRNVPIHIVTSRYLNLTQPSALYLIKDRLGDKVDLRFFNDATKSFHPKTYIVHFADGNGCVFVGSSNVSRSALITGIEWNYLLEKMAHEQDFNEFEQAFDMIYEFDSTIVDDDLLKEYAKSWISPKVHIGGEDLPSAPMEDEQPEPLPVQREALYELKKLREEGHKRALVIAATGIGKTYLSAFDCAREPEKFHRVLFVAHREEILEQAEQTFLRVMPEKSTAYFGGGVKENHADIIFAMVQTLGKAEYLQESYFGSRDFQYIVVDEFHHAAANSYERVLEYFKPEFLLGLTATPFRLDNKDIFRYCDHNIAYEVNLKDAINRGWLVPFRYYGIHDEIDYSQVEWSSGQYNVEQLERVLATHERADLILKHYLKYRRGKGLGFCASIHHAEYMTEYFRQFEIKAVVVHSDTNTGCRYRMERNQAIEKMKAGKIDMIFSVDMFNEGVDIPVVDLVLFLRPTESYTVFLQQLGRGLRKHPGKEYLTILDFIGNYKNVQAKINFFAGDIEMDEALDKLMYNPKEYEEMLPESCIVDFDFKLIDLFKRIAESVSLESKLVYSYKDVKNQLGRRPGLCDMFRFSTMSVELYLKKYGTWLRFLGQMEDLTEEERGWLGTDVEEFLRTVEKTAMSKSYKIPVLLSLVDERQGLLQSEVSLHEVGARFRDFYVNEKIHQKDFKDKVHDGWQTWDLKKFTALARTNPIKYLSENQFFWYDDTRKVFGLLADLEQWLSEGLTELYVDIVNWKNKVYFTRRY